MKSSTKRLVDANLASARALNSPNLTEQEAKIIVEFLDQQETADVEQVIHGRWKPYHEADIGYDEYGVRCSNCGFEVEDHEVKFVMHYCPNCGAKNGR